MAVGTLSAKFEDEPIIFQIFLKVIVHVCPFPFAAQHVKSSAGRDCACTEFAIFWDWLSFAVRWLHVITGIAWIGSSFYFVALDLGLRQRPGLPAGAYRRGMAGPRRRLLPHPEISGGAGRDARAPDLVQMGILRHLAVRLRDAVRRLLRRRRPLPDRPQRARRLAAGRRSSSRWPRSASAGWSTTCSASRRSATTTRR